MIDGYAPHALGRKASESELRMSLFDHLNELRDGFPIALVSLGATRRMTIRAKAQPRRVIHVDLEAGSLLVMDYATQIHYTHAVPKTIGEVGERISLAFRVKRAGKAAEDRARGDQY